MATTNYSTLWWLVGYLVLCTTSTIADHQQLDDLDTEIIDGQCLRITGAELMLSASEFYELDVTGIECVCVCVCLCAFHVGFFPCFLS